MNIHKSKYIDGDLNLLSMIEHIFRKSKGEGDCSACKKNVKGTIQRKILVLPKSLIIVLDRFDDKG